MNKKLLITIHGINSSGEWQEIVVGALSRYFTCESMKYRGYRHLGFFRNCFSLWILPLLGGAGAVGIWWSVIAGIVAAVLSLMLAAALAIRKRGRLEKTMLTEYNNMTERHGDRSPHAIAHSFGTYLLCSIISKFQGAVTFDRMVLFGSVVDVRLAWAELGHAGAVKAVRNETGKRDYVSRLAGCAFWIRGMGNSGIKGFSSCGEITENIDFTAFSHTDSVKLRKHIRENWLPFFWGIPPKEYQKLLDACDACLNELPENRIGPPDAFPGFNSQEWSWTINQGAKTSFEKYLKAFIHEFYLRHRHNLNKPQLDACYALARHTFWTLCQKLDDHPRLIAARAAERAIDLVSTHFR